MPIGPLIAQALREDDCTQADRYIHGSPVALSDPSNIFDRITTRFGDLSHVPTQPASAAHRLWWTAHTEGRRLEGRTRR